MKGGNSFRWLLTWCLHSIWNFLFSGHGISAEVEFCTKKPWIPVRLDMRRPKCGDSNHILDFIFGKIICFFFCTFEPVWIIEMNLFESRANRKQFYKYHWWCSMMCDLAIAFFELWKYFEWLFVSGRFDIFDPNIDTNLAILNCPRTEKVTFFFWIVNRKS